MIRLGIRAGLALFFSTTMSWADSSPVDPAISPFVDAYVAAWIDPTRGSVGAIVGEATVFDVDWGRRISAERLATYLEAFRGVTLELLSRNAEDKEKVVLEWRATGTNQAWNYTDTLTFAGSKLERVDWKGQAADPDETAWAERFIAARNSLDGETFRTFMDPAGRVMGRTLPTVGYSVEGFIDFLQGLKGTVYERQGTLPIARAKDGHIYYQFRVRRSPGATLVSGRDHLVRKDGLVTLFEGVY